MVNDARVVLITGATRGIGFATARGLAAHGHTVLVGARDILSGENAVAELRRRELPGTVRAVVIDVTDADSVAGAAREVERDFGRLDALVNNAGVNIGFTQPPSEAHLDDVRAVYDTDVFGVVAVTTAFIPLLDTGNRPRIVNVSSFRGSLGSRDAWVGPWSFGYGTAKAALNMITAQYAHELADRGYVVTAVSPGHVATALTGNNAPLTPDEGAVTIIRLAEASDELPDAVVSGAFLDENGVTVPW